MNTTIQLNRLRLHARHGVMPQEQIIGNDFEVTVHLSYPFAEGGKADDINRTANYAEIANIVKTQMAIPSKTIENVAWRIREALLEAFPLAGSGMVTVAKLVPPIPAEVESAAVRIDW